MKYNGLDIKIGDVLAWVVDAFGTRTASLVRCTWVGEFGIKVIDPAFGGDIPKEMTFDEALEPIGRDLIDALGDVREYLIPLEPESSKAWKIN